WSPAWQAWAQSVASLVVCVFVAMIVVPAAHHAGGQMEISTPALDMPDGWRAMAMPVGAALMFCVAVARMLALPGAKVRLTALATVGMVAGALWLAAPGLLAMGNLNLLVFFVALVAGAIVVGTPIAFAFGIATVSYLAL